MKLGGSDKFQPHEPRIWQGVPTELKSQVSKIYGFHQIVQGAGQLATEGVPEDEAHQIIAATYYKVNNF